MPKDKSDKTSGLKEKFLRYYRELPVVRLAAANIGRDEDTVMRWRTQDADFAEQIEMLKSEWALQKIRGVRSPEWVLERVLRDHFSPPKQSVEQTGSMDVLHIYKPEKRSEG